MHRRRSPTHEGRKFLQKAQVDPGPADIWECFERARAQRWAIPHQARSYFKTHIHQRFPGKNACFFDIVCQMGGIPREFAAAWNEQTDVRLEVSWLETYNTPDLAF